MRGGRRKLGREAAGWKLRLRGMEDRSWVRGLGGSRCVGTDMRKRSGRPKATTQSEDNFLRVNSLRDRRLTGQQLQAQLNTGRSKEVSVSTVKRRHRAAGLTGRVAVRKPLLRWQNKKKRLAWAMKRRQWTTENWKKVLWTDESKFEIFGSSRRVCVRCQVGG